MAEESAKRKAEFIMATGISPSEYDKLTLTEYRAFIEVVNERRKG